MTVRCKLRCDSIEPDSDGSSTRRIKFSTVYDQDIPEDQRFFRATPWGSMEQLIDNPTAIEQFRVGAYYYVDLTPVTQPA